MGDRRPGAPPFSCEGQREAKPERTKKCPPGRCTGRRPQGMLGTLRSIRRMPLRSLVRVACHSRCGSVVHNLVAF